MKRKTTEFTTARTSHVNTSLDPMSKSESEFSVPAMETDENKMDELQQRVCDIITIRAPSSDGYSLWVGYSKYNDFGKYDPQQGKPEKIVEIDNALKKGETLKKNKKKLYSSYLTLSAVMRQLFIQMYNKTKGDARDYYSDKMSLLQHGKYTPFQFYHYLFSIDKEGSSIQNVFVRTHTYKDALLHLVDNKLSNNLNLRVVRKHIWDITESRSALHGWVKRLQEVYDAQASQYNIDNIAVPFYCLFDKQVTDIILIQKFLSNYAKLKYMNGKSRFKIQLQEWILKTSEEELTLQRYKNKMFQDWDEFARILDKKLRSIQDEMNLDTKPMHIITNYNNVGTRDISQWYKMGLCLKGCGVSHKQCKYTCNRTICHICDEIKRSQPNAPGINPYSHCADACVFGENGQQIFDLHNKGQVDLNQRLCETINQKYGKNTVTLRNGVVNNASVVQVPDDVHDMWTEEVKEIVGAQYPVTLSFTSMLPEVKKGASDVKITGKELMTGVCKFYNSNKHFGFIIPNDGSDECFFRGKNLQGDQGITKGMNVYFQLKVPTPTLKPNTGHGHRRVAAMVTIPTCAHVNKVSSQNKSQGRNSRDKNIPKKAMADCGTNRHVWPGSTILDDNKKYAFNKSSFHQHNIPITTAADATTASIGKGTINGLENILGEVYQSANPNLVPLISPQILTEQFKLWVSMIGSSMHFVDATKINWQVLIPELRKATVLSLKKNDNGVFETDLKDLAKLRNVQRR